MKEHVDVAASDALLIVDVQNDFISGTMAIPGAPSIVPVINRLVAEFQHVIVAHDWHPPGHISFASAHAGAKPGDTVTTPYGPQRVFPDHCVQGTPGAELDVRPRARESRVDPPQRLSGERGQLLGILRERSSHGHRPRRLFARRAGSKEYSVPDLHCTDASRQPPREHAGSSSRPSSSWTPARDARPPMDLTSVRLPSFEHSASA